MPASPPPGIRRQRAARERQELRKAPECRQHPLEAEQGREVRGVGGQRPEIDLRGLGVPAGALQLEPLPDRLRPGRRPGLDGKCQRQGERGAGGSTVTH